MSRPAPVSLLSRTVTVASLLACTQAALAADLTVTIENIQDGSGQVLVGVFDSPAAFPKEIKRGQILPASRRDAAGSVKVGFTGLPEGTYVVSAIHDKDSNGKLTTNLVGTPTEPYGFTGKGSGSFGPPAFKDVSFELPADGAAIRIAIK